MANKLFHKNSNIPLTKNFKSSEFDCSCNNCATTMINMQLIQLLQYLRDKFNKPVKINSGYRCLNHNADIGGAINSQHPKGNAADIVISGISPDEVAQECEKLFSGVGKYDTFTHVDVRSNIHARWDNRNN